MKSHKLYRKFFTQTLGLMAGVGISTKPKAENKPRKTIHFILLGCLCFMMGCNNSKSIGHKQKIKNKASKINYCDSIQEYDSDPFQLKYFLEKHNNTNNALLNCGTVGCFYEKEKYFKCDLAILKIKHHCNLNRNDSIYLDSFKAFIKEIDSKRIHIIK